MRRISYILVLVAIAGLWALAAGGCVSTPKNPIPRRGELVAQGTGQLSFRASEAGLVSVYDVNTDSVIHSSAVVRGSVVSVNPQDANITVTDADRAGSQIVNTGINKSHRYEMWFIPVQGGTYTATRPSQTPGQEQQQP